MLSFSAKHNLPQFQNLKISFWLTKGEHRDSPAKYRTQCGNNGPIGRLSQPTTSSVIIVKDSWILWKSLECWNAIITRNRESSIWSQHKRALQPLIDVNNFQCLAQGLLSTQKERDELNESARCCELKRWEEDEPQWISFTQFTQKNCAMIVICPNLSFVLLSPFMLSAWFNELINRMGTS